MPSPTVRLALALDLLLIAVEHAFHAARHVLPIGGEPLIQLGILLCIGIALEEIVRTCRRKKR